VTAACTLDRRLAAATGLVARVNVGVVAAPVIKRATVRHPVGSIAFVEPRQGLPVKELHTAGERKKWTSMLEVRTNPAQDLPGPAACSAQ